MKRKILLLTALLNVAVLFVTSCKEPEPDYPKDITINNFPEDRRIPAPVFTYTTSAGNALLKWKNLSYVESYILYVKNTDGDYIVNIKPITLAEIQYDANYETNKYITYTISTATINPSNQRSVFGLRAISVDGIKSNIYWAPRD